jgi:hypothetical protein
MNLTVLENRVGVVRLNNSDSIPSWATQGNFWSITRTEDELSVVTDEHVIPKDLKAELDWRLIKVIGPLDFSMVGVLSSLAEPLAKKSISIFVISTFDTDYLMVQDKNLTAAIETLKTVGHLVSGKV